VITRIELCYAHALKVSGPAAIRFSTGLNILVGPNGSGKSTVLRAVKECDRCRKQTEGIGSCVYFNAETMNPHAPNGPPADMRNMILQTRGVFSSHGEIMKAALATVPLRRGETLLADEPEAGQDMASVRRIRAGFDAIVRQGGQVIAATHHPFMLRDANVIELEPGYAETLRKEFCGTEPTPRPAATAPREHRECRPGGRPRAQLGSP
jgi:predicted ATPase